MLIEFQTMFFPNGYKNELFNLMLNGVTPIIAHPERYRQVQLDVSIVENWIDTGYIIQIDCGSILGTFGNDAKRISHIMLKKNLCHLIGSDAHNDKKRNFCLDQTFKALTFLLDKKSINIINQNSKNILEGKDCKFYYNTKKNNIVERFNKIFKL